ncbi:MAG: helix-turn-helix transcriptional regulator [Bilophila wadsworthia]
MGIHSKESVMLDVIGNSMEPLIRHKDTILVDQSVKEPSDGKIFSLASVRSFWSSVSSARPAAGFCARKTAISRT